MKIITIDREYGAGGHSIGQEVAKRLGIEFYDRDIISGAAQMGGIKKELVEEAEESRSKTDSFLHALMPSAFDVKDSIFDYEAETIINLAEKGPAVFLGRCAGAILKDMNFDPLRVFLFADMEARLPRVRELLETQDDDEARRAMHKIDLSRRSYYDYYSGGRHWGTRDEHELLINTGVISAEAAIDIICNAVQE